MQMGYYLFRRCEANRRMETEEQLRRRLWRPIVGAGEGDADASQADPAAVLASLGVSATDAESQRATAVSSSQISAASSNGR